MFLLPACSFPVHSSIFTILPSVFSIFLQYVQPSMKKLRKILLVDDDRVNNFLNESLLEELNIAEEIMVLTNGKQALEHILDHCATAYKICPEIVIFDHFMPVMDGMEFIKALHTSDFINRSKVVFILLGIQSKPEDIAAFQRLGVQEFTTKPLSPEVVRDACRKYFSGDTAKNHAK